MIRPLSIETFHDKCVLLFHFRRDARPRLQTNDFFLLLLVSAADEWAPEQNFNCLSGGARPLANTKRS